MPYSEGAEALLGAKEWWLDQDGQTFSYEVLSAKGHNGKVIARFVGFASRTVAESLKGASVAIPRSRFPVLGADEFYWTDLIGLGVVNEAGEALGGVSGLLDNGAHQILEVRQVLPEGRAKERLIPFVSKFVKTVDRERRCITVDWNSDF